MKKILLLLVAMATFSGCDLDDDETGPPVRNDLVPVDSVEMPSTFEKGEVYTIKVTYLLPTDCHTLYGMDHRTQNETVFLTVIASVDPTDTSCVEEEGLSDEFEFDFTAERNDLYIFKFWQGIDENDEPIYLTKEVEVIDE